MLFISARGKGRYDKAHIFGITMRIKHLLVIIITFSFLLLSCQNFTQDSTISLSVEPYLTEEDLNLSVPNFLDEDQQLLYRQANSLYRHMFSGSTAAIEYRETYSSVEISSWVHETIKINEKTYTKAMGPYQNWDDFDRTIHSVFTESFWDEKNDNQIYINNEGLLYFMELERGSGYYYNENFPDEFELIKKSDTEISFILIAHYSPVWPNEGETTEERDKRRAREYDYTIQFPMKLILTNDGWKFDEFHNGLADEKASEELDDFDVTLEPPLSDKYLSLPVPDFLSEDLQLLYRKAYVLYKSFGFSNLIEFSDSKIGYKYEPYRPNNDEYLISPYGRYNNYAHFELLIKSIFTSDYWDKLNSNLIYKNCDGFLCYIDTGPPGSITRNWRFEDTFELISQTDTKIEFYVIGYYSYRYFINEQESEEQRELRLSSNYEYIEKHPVTFILTENGWRVDYFENIYMDEGNYVGIYSK